MGKVRIQSGCSLSSYFSLVWKHISKVFLVVLFEIKSYSAYVMLYTTFIAFISCIRIVGNKISVIDKETTKIFPNVI